MLNVNNLTELIVKKTLYFSIVKIIGVIPGTLVEVTLTFSRE